MFYYARHGAIYSINLIYIMKKVLKIFWKPLVLFLPLFIGGGVSSRH